MFATGWAFYASFQTAALKEQADETVIYHCDRRDNGRLEKPSNAYLWKEQEEGSQTF